jgi:hypothetical protein
MLMQYMYLVTTMYNALPGQELVPCYPGKTKNTQAPHIDELTAGSRRQSAALEFKTIQYQA